MTSVKLRQEPQAITANDVNAPRDDVTEPRQKTCELVGSFIRSISSRDSDLSVKITAELIRTTVEHQKIVSADVLKNARETAEPSKSTKLVSSAMNCAKKVYDENIQCCMVLAD